MVVRPSEIMRYEEIGAKDAKIAELLGEIVPMLDELDRQSLYEVKAILEVKLREAISKAEEIKHSTRIGTSK